MKKTEIKVGGIYLARVSGRLVRMEIQSESVYGGWHGRNLTTGYGVRVKSAARLRSEVHKCQDCDTFEDLEFGPEPFAQDVHGINDPVWMCGACREKSSEEI
jgi:hypothetical protein